MAQNSSIFNKWNSYDQEAAKSETVENISNTMLPAVSTELEAAILWPQQLECTTLPVPTQIHFQRSNSNVLESSDSRYDREQVSEFQSDCNRMYFDGLFEVSPALDPNQFPAIHRSISDPTGTQLEDVSPVMDHLLKAPAKRRGRRRASESSDGWFPSKNLISERKRREKLKEGLLELRSLVPKITKMDKVSILSDAINHVQDLKQKVEMLEYLNNAVGDGCIDYKMVELGKSSGSDLEISEAGNEGTENQNNLSTNGSCSKYFDEVLRCDYQMLHSSSKDLNLHQMQLNVTKLDHGIYRLNITCIQQSGVLVQLSQAIELFVLEIVHTNIVVLTPTKVTCTFIVKMSSWNDMTLENVKADIKQLLGQSGLQF